MSVCRELGIIDMPLERYTHLLIKYTYCWWAQYDWHPVLTDATPCKCQCLKLLKFLLSQIRFSLIRTGLTNLWLVHVTYEVHSSLLHRTDACNSSSTHTHTQIHVYADFLFRVSVYVTVLGLQGFGMSLDPGLRHTRTGLPQDVRRVWCSSVLILPQTTGHRTYNTHSCSGASRCASWWLDWFV